MAAVPDSTGPTAEEVRPLLERWYKLDRSAKPPVYRLQHPMARGPCSLAQWHADSPRLAAFLQQHCHEDIKTVGNNIFIQELHINCEFIISPLRSTISELHHELRATMLGEGADPSRTLLVRRHITANEPEAAAEKDESLVYVDETPARKAAMQALDVECSQSLPPENIFSYQVPWVPGKGIDTTDRMHSLALESLTEVVFSRTKAAIDAAAAEPDPLESDPVLLEVVEHAAFGRRLAEAALPGPTDSTLKTVLDYVDGPDQGAPLVLYGEPGAGARTIMALVAVRLRDRIKDGGLVLVTRFVGATPASCNERVLLTGICRQICRAHGLSDLSIADMHEKTIEQSRRCLQLASAERPLILLLAAPHHLHAHQQSRQLLWLPKLIPPHVKIVLAVSADPATECIPSLQNRYPTSTFVAIPNWKLRDGELLLQQLLPADPAASKAARRASMGSNILASFRPAFAQCRLPWMAKLVALMCGESGAPSNGLPASVLGMLGRVLARIESKVPNRGMVQLALAYLACSLHGLTAAELDDLLAVKQESLGCTRQRVSPLQWVQLQRSLAPLLIRVGSGGARLFRFAHETIKVAAEQRYLSDPAVRRQRHSELADYFSGACSSEADVYVADQGLVLLGSTRMERQLSGPGRAGVPVRINHRRLIELPYHYVHAGRPQELVENCLLSMEWLQAKLEGLSIYDLFDDFDGALVASTMLDERSLCLIRQALQDARAHVVTEDPWQLASQLVGRLLIFEGLHEELPYVQRLLANIRQQWHMSMTHARLVGEVTILPELGWQCLPAAGNPLANSYAGHSSSIHSAIISKNSHFGFTASVDGVVKMWKLESSQLISEFLHPGESVSALCLSPSNALLFVGLTSGVVHVWQVDTGVQLGMCEQHIGEITGLATATDQMYVAVSSDESMVANRVILGRGAVKIKQTMQCKSQHGPYLCVALSADDSVLVAGCQTGMVEQRDMVSGKLLRTFCSPGVSSPIYALAVSTETLQLVFVTEAFTICKFDVVTGAAIAVFADIIEWATCACLSPDGQLALAATREGPIVMFDTVEEDVVGTLYGKSVVVCLAVSQDGQVALSGNDQKLVDKWVLPDAREPIIFRGHGGAVQLIGMAPSGKHMVTVGSEMATRCVVWDMATGSVPAFFVHAAAVTCLAVAGKSGLVVSGAHGELQLWELLTGTPVRTIVLESWIPCALALPHNSTDRIVVGTRDGLVAVLESGGRVRAQVKAHSSAVLCLSARHDGTSVVSVGVSDDVPVSWQLPDLEQLCRYASCPGRITCFSLAAKGNIAWAGCSDGMIRRYQASTGRLQGTLKGHTGELVSIMLSADGRTAISGTAHGELLTWRHSENAGRFTLEREYIKEVVGMAGAMDLIPAKAVLGCKNGLLSSMTLRVRSDDGQEPSKNKRAWSMANFGLLSDEPSFDHYGSRDFNVDSSFFFASEAAIGAIDGDIKTDVRALSRSVKVYLAAPYQDTAVEAAAIIDQVWPRLRDHAHRCDVEFTLVYKHEGYIHLEANQQLLDEDMKDTLGKASKLTCIALVGDKYGDMLLPSTLDVDVFDSTAAGNSKKAGCNLQ